MTSSSVSIETNGRTAEENREVDQATVWTPRPGGGQRRSIVYILAVAKELFKGSFDLQRIREINFFFYSTVVKY